MRRRRSFFNSVSHTIDGIDEVLYEAINIAYQNDNIDILGETISIINHVIYSSINTATIAVFERNLLLIERLYSISSASKGKHSSYLKRTSYNSIKEKISSIIYKIDENLDTPNNEILVKQFLKFSLTSFNTILHESLINKDYETYRDAAYEFYTFIFNKYRYPEAEKNKDVTREIEYYVNSIGILQYSWILYLYKEKKLTQTECKDLLKANPISFRNYERVLDTLIFIDGMPFMYTFGVDDWEKDIKEKKNGSMAYSPLQPKYWAALGMMIYLIKNDSIVTNEITPSRIRSSENFFEAYFEQFQSCISEIKRHKDIWIPIIFDSTLSIPTNNSDNMLPILTTNDHEKDFYKKIEKISASLKAAESQLVKGAFLKNNEKLVSEPFAEDKILKFKEAVGSQWYNRSFLHRLFDNYANYKEIEDSDTVPISRIFIFSIGSKTMFTEKGNSLLGSADSGGIIANYEDGEFLKSIKTKNTPVRQFNGIVDCLDTLIENVKNNKFKPTVIILGSDWKYLTTELALNENFIPSWKVKESIGQSNLDYALYKEIPLYTSYNDDFDEYIVVADFENAFILNQVRNDNWYKRQMQIDTIPIDNTEAKRIFDEDPQITYKDIELSEEEAITYIKTGVIWDIIVRGEFKVQNTLAYSIGQIHVKENNIS